MPSDSAWWQHNCPGYATGTECSPKAMWNGPKVHNSPVVLQCDSLIALHVDCTNERLDNFLTGPHLLRRHHPHLHHLWTIHSCLPPLHLLLETYTKHKPKTIQARDADITSSTFVPACQAKP